MRRLLSIRWWLPFSFALIAAVTALVVAQVFTAQSRTALRSKAEDLAAGTAVGAAARIGSSKTVSETRARTTEQARARRVSLFVFDVNGRLLSTTSSQGTSAGSVPNMRSLVEHALSGQRFVASLDNGRRITVALPLRASPGAALVEVAARPDLVAATSIVRDRIWVAAGWATAVGAMVGFFVSLLITGRVRRVGRSAAAIERGEFETQLTSRFPDELGQLANAVDTMRRRLKASFGELAGERDQLRLLIDQLQEGVIGVREDRTVAVSNARASQLLGEPVEEGVPLPNPWPAADLESVLRSLFLPRARPRTIRVSPAPDHTYAVTGLPAHATGTAVLVVTDVTAQERRDRAEREFVANAAHELRTPLAAIASAVDVLQHGAKNEAHERDRFLAVIERQTARLNRLVRALLTLARAQGRDEPLPLESVDVAALVREIAVDLEISGDKLELDPGAFALGHEDLLRQAIENLVANARKYAGDDGLVIAVRAQGEDTIAVEVRDRGPGMTPAETERVVERFFRRGDRDSDGFGLGLSIVREVARVLDGHLEIETHPGFGTTARVLVPRAGASDRLLLRATESSDVRRNGVP